MRIPTWVTLDGRRLRLDEMTTDHVRNALAMCERNQLLVPHPIRQRWIDELRFELLVRQVEGRT